MMLAWTSIFSFFLSFLLICCGNSEWSSESVLPSLQTHTQVSPTHRPLARTTVQLRHTLYHFINTPRLCSLSSSQSCPTKRRLRVEAGQSCPAKRGLRDEAGQSRTAKRGLRVEAGQSQTAKRGLKFQASQFGTTTWTEGWDWPIQHLKAKH